MSYDLSGQTAIVTDGAGGIGSAVAKRFTLSDIRESSARGALRKLAKRGVLYTRHIHAWTSEAVLNPPCDRITETGVFSTRTETAWKA